MKYTCRPGVVMEKICGVRLLIPTLKAYEACPRVIRLTLPAAMAWELLRLNKPIEDVYKILAILLKKPNDEVERIASKLFSSLVDAGALIVQEE